VVENIEQATRNAQRPSFQIDVRCWVFSVRCSNPKPCRAGGQRSTLFAARFGRRRRVHDKIVMHRSAGVHFRFVPWRVCFLNHKYQIQTMKKSILHSLISILAICALAGCVCTKGEKHHNKEAKQAKLMAEAKVSKDDAGKTALAKAPNGTIKKGELEKEKGKLIWSFDITTPDTKDITEVNVDAITGDVVSVEKESAESEAKEAAGEKEKK
jgi:uncharacterized membrane protein YkoI